MRLPDGGVPGHVGAAGAGRRAGGRGRRRGVPPHRRVALGPGRRRRGVELSVPRGRLPRLAGVVVHRSTDLRDTHVTRRRAVPVTNPLRTLVDLGAVAPPWAVEDARDRALVARLLTVAGVEATLDDLGRRGRRGVGVLREVLERRALGAARPDGLLEPRMARLLRRHGLPAAEFQHEVRNTGRLVARADVAYPERRIAIEVDGWESHATPEALQTDLARQNGLVAWAGPSCASPGPTRSAVPGMSPG